MNKLFELRHGKKYEDVINACHSGLTMVKAAESLNIPYKTFIRIAKKLECYAPNQGARGTNKKNIPLNKFELQDILDGKHPTYGSSKLRLRLLSSGIKEAKCEICGTIEWNGMPVPLELDHIDGNNSNNLLANLRIICPNCHHQTPTHSSKNRKA